MYMHLVPALVTWALRWHPRSARFGALPETLQAGRDEWEAASFAGLVLAPMALHACWAVAYYLKVLGFRVQGLGFVYLAVGAGWVEGGCLATGPAACGQWERVW